MSKVPSQHHLFAHRVLRDVALGHEPRVFAILNGPDGEAYLEDLWDRTALVFPESPPRPLEGMELSIANIHGYGLAYLIKMPTPQTPPEAHWVAMMVSLPREAQSLQEIRGVRYFTLEASQHPIDQREHTMLCEWTEDGKHMNYGEGPAAEDEEAFVKAVITQLSPHSPTQH